jgi:hypothetical protein
MKINVYFGKGNGTYVDDRKPLEQVKLVKKFIKEGKDFNIVTCSPYVIEAVDTYKKDSEIKYFNDGIETTFVKVLTEISEASYKLRKDGN